MIVKKILGVTLIEMIVAIAVFAIGMGTIFTVFPSGFAVAQKNKNLSTAYELAVGCLEKCREYDLFGGSTYDSSGSTYGKTEREYFGKTDAPSPSGTIGALINTKGKFVRCDKILDVKGGSSNPESLYFYKTDFVPVVDKARLYAEYPHKRKGEDVHGIKVNLGYEGFASMYRVTCTVRGPYPPGTSENDVVDEKFLEQSGPVEAILSTMIANDRLGDALLAETKYVRENPNNSISVSTNAYNGKVIETTGMLRLGKLCVDDTDSDGDGLTGTNTFFIRIKKLTHRVRPEDFTCFLPEALNYYELVDTGPTIVQNYYKPNNTVSMGKDTVNWIQPNDRKHFYGSQKYLFDNSIEQLHGLDFYFSGVMDGWENLSYTNKIHTYTTNVMGLDNIVIYCPRRIMKDGTYNLTYSHAKCSYTDGGWVAESNKIVRMYPPNSAGNNSQHWRFDLLNSLIARDNDYEIRNRANPVDQYGRDKYRQGLLMDQVFDGDCIVEKDGVEYAGYPEGFYISGNIRGTRVRSLVTINGGTLDGYEYFNTEGSTKVTGSSDGDY